MERRSFDELELQQLWSLLLADIRRRGADEQTAEDIVQETWLRALRNPPADCGRLRGWLHVVALRLLRDARKRGRNRAERELMTARINRVPSPRAVDDSRLMRYVEELPEPYGTVVRLRFVQDREVAEIARLTKCPPKTVRSQLHRGLQRLRVRVQGNRLERFAGLGFTWLLEAKRLASRRSLVRSFSLPALGTVALLGSWMLWSLDSTRSSSVEVPALALTVADSAQSPAVLAQVANERVPTPGSVRGPGEAPLPERRQLSGRVRAPDGAPVSFAQVFTAPADTDRPSRSALADEAGRYTIEVERQELVWAVHESWCTSRRSYIATPGDLGELDLFLVEPRGVLEVSVEDQEGTPVEGALVWADPKPETAAIMSPRGTLALTHPSLEVTTDAAGEARLLLPARDRELVSFGTERPKLIVLAQGFPAWSSNDEPPDGKTRLSIVLPRPAVVHGRCTDAAGLPAWNAHVEVLQLGGRVRLESVTGPDGTFEIDGVAPGEFVVRAREDPSLGIASARREDSLEEGERVEVALELTAGSTIHGRALALGSPLADATVAITPLIPLAAEGRTERIVRTDPAGRFAFGGCTGRDEYLLRVTAPGRDFASLELESVRPDVEGLALVLSPESTLAPIVLEFSGTPERLPRSVDLSRDVPPFSHVLEPAPDRFLSAPLPAGVYRVVAWLPDLGPWMAGVIEHAPDAPTVHCFPVPERGTLEVALDLPPDVAPDDVWAYVQVPGFNRYGLGGLGAPHGLRELQWDPERSTFSADVAPGSYGLGIAADGLAAANERVHVAAGTVSAVRLTASAGVDARIVLRSPRDLEPFEHLKFQVVTPGGTREIVRGIDCRRRTESGLEFTLRLSRSATELRAVSWCSPKLRRAALPSQLEGSCLIGVELEGAPPTLEMELSERPN